MKKNIGYVNLNSSLFGWLINKLKKAPSDLDGSRELLTSLKDLSAGTYSSLMVEMDGTKEPYSNEDRLVCGDLSIDVRTHRVIRAGEEITLTPKEFDILLFLARNSGEVFTKDQIYEAVWKDEHMLDDSNIMAFIRKLRKKIEPSPDAPKYILTVWGIGYKFNDRL